MPLIPEFGRLKMRIAVLHDSESYGTQSALLRKMANSKLPQCDPIKKIFPIYPQNPMTTTMTT